MNYDTQVKFEELVGKTFSNIEIIKEVYGKADTITFTCLDGSVYEMYHSQDCCEYVYIEEIAGDIKNLIGSKILIAQENSCEADTGIDNSETWTFYKLATIKGWVDIRWFGSSNGYYSEDVSLFKIEEK